MSFETLERSRDSSQPIELYKFTFVNLNKSFYYTNAEEEIIHLANTYIPVTISRDAVSYNQDASSEMNISIETKSEICSLLFRMNHPEIVSMTIYRMQIADSSYAPVFVGYLGSHQGNEKMTTLTPLPPAAFMLRNMLTRVYGVQCPYTLYDGTSCRVDQSLFQVTGELDSVSGSTITSSAFATKEDGWFDAGVIKIGTLSYMPLSHVGNTIVLDKAPLYAKSGDSFTAFAGCDHTLQTCNDKFNNTANNGGDPFQPTDNLFTSGLESNSFSV